MEETNGLNLVAGLMQKFGETGDAVVALRWALPKVLEEVKAEAGSLFMYRDEDAMLECVVCLGPVDITGMLVPVEQGLVGRAFSTGEAEIVSNAETDGAHYHLADARSGFRTITTITAPVKLGDDRFGVIEAINRRKENISETICFFEPSDLSLLSSLASVLAMAVVNMRLAEKVISDQILQRDLDQATEAQATLIPDIDPTGHIAGKVLPARQLSGDFMDFRHIGSRIMFCQGDVAGKGITAALLMAQVVSVFRLLARQEKNIRVIASQLNDEFIRNGSDQYITFVLGWLDIQTGEAELINCGHGPIIWQDDQTGKIEMIPSHTVPLGIADLFVETLVPWKGNLACSALYLATDGITEALSDGKELGIEGLAQIIKTHRNLSSSKRVTSIMRRFLEGKLITHDDASLLVVTGTGQMRDA